MRFLKWTGIAILAAIILLAGVWLLFPRAAQSALAAMLPRYLALRSGTGAFVSGPPSKKEMKVPMRDGVRLATDVYLPQTPAPYPVIAIRTPYAKAEGAPIADFFGRYGYAVLVQDVRGRHASEGEYYPMRNEATDGLDFTRWIKSQPWCNGKVGAFGGSYLGFTQWAMAPGNPGLASIAPVFSTSNFYHSVYNAGAFGKLTYLHWSLTSYGRYGNMAGAAHIDKGYKHFPLAESDDAALQDVPFYNDWVAHPAPDAYWRELGVDHRMAEVNTPAFLTAGWYDFVLEAELRDFHSLLAGAGPRARAASRLMIGPWSHSFFNPNLKGYGIEQRTLELLPFEFIREVKDWYDYSLKGVANGWENRPRVRAYVLGENRWRDEQQWPPARVVYRPFYLHSRGDAQTLRGGGAIIEAGPAESEPQDTYAADPRNPVPTVGGAHEVPERCGPLDQRKVEERSDVLVYSTAPLAKPLLVMGPVAVRLFASSSAPDTDFTAKLVDVFPDGRALILCEGIMRARYRAGLDKPEPLKRGEVYRFEIKVGNTAVRFQAGHRIRLEIASANAPRYDPNPNTGAAIATERNPVVAMQKIFHEKDRPSALILPVVPE